MIGGVRHTANAIAAINKNRVIDFRSKLTSSIGISAMRLISFFMIVSYIKTPRRASVS